MTCPGYLPNAYYRLFSHDQFDINITPPDLMCFSLDII